MSAAAFWRRAAAAAASGMLILSGCASTEPAGSGEQLDPEGPGAGTTAPADMPRPLPDESDGRNELDEHNEGDILANEDDLPAGGPAPGVSESAVLFGQSAAFNGPAAELGNSMQVGLKAAFDEVNRQGGVHGRRLELVSLDDAYEPEKALTNTHRLIEENQVFSLIGAVGTPTSRSATPVAASHGVPYVAPFTGAAFLRDPELDNVINLRASYDQETEEMVERLTADMGIERIAVMYQDDSFGRAGYRGARAALERRGMEPVSIGLYTRNTTAVKSGLLDVQQGQPEAVIVVGAYQPVASLIKWARRIGLGAVFITLSFVGSNALAEELGDEGVGVFATQVMPYPTDEKIPAVASYLDALERHDPDAVPGFVSIEGYLAGRLAIAGLQECGPALDRTCFLESFNRLKGDELDGFSVDFGPGDNQGSDAVFLTVIDANGQYRSIETMLEAAP